MITWFDSWNGCVHCSMCKCSRIINSLLKHIHMGHWKACHDFLSLCQLDWMFHLLMNVVRVCETLPYHFLFCHELLCFVTLLMTVLLLTKRSFLFLGIKLSVSLYIFHSLKYMKNYFYYTCSQCQISFNTKLGKMSHPNENNVFLEV